MRGNPPDTSLDPYYESLRAACLAGALALLVAFWFDGGLFTLATAAVFWILLELSQIRSAECGVRNPPSLGYGATSAETGQESETRNQQSEAIQKPEIGPPPLRSGTATLARNCGVSLRTLQRYFINEMGKSPKVWLSEQRQQRAFELIQDGSSVKETAGSLDYKHSTHLSRDYKGHWGCCPTDKTAPIRVQNP